MRAVPQVPATIATPQTHRRKVIPIRPILDVARELGLGPDELELYGPFKAKVKLSVFRRLTTRPHAKLIVVTSMTATPAGEGKTCTAIGLTQGLRGIGQRAVLCLREPSLGPLLGFKGGGTGTGRAQVVPAEDINLHFTGDLHAITTAHNLLAAVVDNHIVHGNRLRIDPVGESLRRAIDIPDRQLRHIISGLGGRGGGLPRESGFDITAASEIMAVVALAKDLDDLKRRLGRMLIGLNARGAPVTVQALKIVGALAVILKDAIKPNLVQTLEGQPALVHAGPFANVSHGNSSVIALQLGMRTSDYVITESGFGVDLGAEKFFDIVCPQARLRPAAAVVVASVRALKSHGGVAPADLKKAHLQALERGCANLERHLETIKLFGVPAIVAINRFPTDTTAELGQLELCCRRRNVPVAISEAVTRGGAGAAAVAEAVVATIKHTPSRFKPLYTPTLSLEEKLETIARRVYGADGIHLDRQAEDDLARWTKLGYRRLPVNVAKTQLSLSDNPALKGVPTGWKLRVRECRLAAGAGFIVALCGKTTFMPGLPEHPLAEQLDLTKTGEVMGLS